MEHCLALVNGLIHKDLQPDGDQLDVIRIIKGILGVPHSAFYGSVHQPPMDGVS